MPRRAFLIAGLTLLHFIASLGALALSFAVGMARFDSGRVPGAGERVLGVVSDVLSFPLVQPVAAWISPAWRPSGPPWEHLTFLANSLLWALVITGLIFLAAPAGRRR